MARLMIALVDVLLPLHHTTRYRPTVKRAYPSKAFKSNSACSAVMTPDSTIFRMRNCSSTVDCGGVGGRIDAGAAVLWVEPVMQVARAEPVWGHDRLQP